MGESSKIHLARCASLTGAWPQKSGQGWFGMLHIRSREDAVHTVCVPRWVITWSILSRLPVETTHAAAVGAELAAELPQRRVELRTVSKKRGVGSDLAQSYPLALRGVGDPQPEPGNSLHRMPK